MCICVHINEIISISIENIYLILFQFLISSITGRFSIFKNNPTVLKWYVELRSQEDLESMRA